MIRIVLSGPPSVGKSTQGERLSKALGIPHISSGLLIRQRALEGDLIAQRVLGIVSDGSLAPSRAIVDLVLARLNEDDCVDGFILDGHPRRAEEAEAFMDYLGEGGLTVFVIMEVRAEEAFRRTRRRADAAENRRIEHDPQFFAKRITLYNDETKPVSEVISRRGAPIVTIDANGDVDEVAKELERVVADKVSFKSVIMPVFA